MKKSIFLFMTVAILSLYLVTAECADQRACRNQAGNNWCSPADTNCTYTKFTGTIFCAPDNSFTDTDSDNDSWSDGCDAFKNDSLEWFDMDGDGYGHNYDCNDFDKAIGEDCDPDGDGKTNEEEHAAGTDPNVNDNTHGSGGSGSGSSGSGLVSLCIGVWDCTEWTPCVDGAKTRVCKSTNGCSNNMPDVWEGCPNYVVLKPNVEAAKEPVVVEPEVQIVDNDPAPPVEDNNSNRMTGQAFNTEPGTFKPAAMWLILMLILAVIGFFVWKKGSKSVNNFSF